HRQQSQRDVYVEHPAPAGNFISEQCHGCEVSEETTQRRANNAGQTKNGAKQTHKTRTLQWRENIGNHANGAGKQRGTTNTFYSAKNDQLHHAVTQQRQGAKLTADTTQRGTDQKNRNTQQQHWFTPVLVSQFAVDRYQNR